MIEKLLIKSAASYKRPLLIVIIALILTVIFSIFAAQTKYDNNLSAMIPQNHPDLAIQKYYDRAEQFGSSSVSIIGVEAQDIFTAPVLTYVDKLRNDILQSNDTISQSIISNYFSISTDDAQKFTTAIRSIISNETEFKNNTILLLRKPEFIQSNFGFPLEIAQKIAQKIEASSPDKIYKIVQKPVTSVQAITNTDFIDSNADGMVIEPLLANNDFSVEAIAKAKQKIASWPFYEGLLVNKTGTLTTILVEFANADNDIEYVSVQTINSILAKNKVEGIKTYITGEPVIGESIAALMKTDMAILMPFVLIVVIFLLWLSFRNWIGVLYPLIVIIFSVAAGLGIQAMFGIPLTVVGSAMPVLLVAIASAYGIHQMNHYFMDRSTERFEILTRNMKSVGLAITLSGLTVMIGFGALAIEDFVPIANFGIFTAIGDLIAVGAALYVLPAFLLLSKKPKTEQLKNETKGFIYAILKSFVVLTRKRPVLVVILAGLVTVGFGIGAIWVKSDMNYIAFFKKDNPIHVADDHLNENLAGTQSISVIFDSDLTPVLDRVQTGKSGETANLLTPSILKEIEKFSMAVQKEFPSVKKIISFNDILKKINKEMNGGDGVHFVIPDSENLIAQYLLVFSGSTAAYLTPDHDKLKIMLNFKRTSTAEIEQMREFIFKYFSDDFKKNNHLQVQVTGFAHLASISNELMVEGMVRSIIACIIVVFILLLFILRSLRLSLVAMAPIGITLAVNFGILGYFGISLNSGTAMVSSIAIGIGVDFSIHYITWYRNELRRHKTVQPSLDATILHKGRAILYNMYVIAGGFGVLAFSSFMPLVEFGLLVALCMVTTALASLVVVPALIQLMTRLKKTEFLLLKTHKEKD